MDIDQLSDRLLPESDAISLLADDHERVRRLIGEFERARLNADTDVCGRLAEVIVQELEVHAILEEEIFYPALAATIDHAELVDQARTEHMAVDLLLERIRTLPHDDKMWVAAVTVLGQQFDRHVEDEERELFYLAKKAGIDLVALGKRMRERRNQLDAERGLSHPDAAEGVLA